MHKLNCRMTTMRTTSNIEEDFKHKYSIFCFARDNINYLNLAKLAKFFIYLEDFFI